MGKFIQLTKGCISVDADHKTCKICGGGIGDPIAVDIDDIGSYSHTIGKGVRCTQIITKQQKTSLPLYVKESFQGVTTLINETQAPIPNISYFAPTPVSGDGRNSSKPAALKETNKPARKR